MKVSRCRHWHISALNPERSGLAQNERILATLQGAMTDPPLRLRYEEAVVALRARVAAMRNNGVSAETIARTVHAERRWLTATFKALTPEPWRSRIHDRTLAVDGRLFHA